MTARDVAPIIRHGNTSQEYFDMSEGLVAGKGCLLALLVATALPMSQVSANGGPEAGKRPGQAVEEGLGRYVSPRVQSEVVVFGTWHLREFQDWLEPRHLDSTLALLERFEPTRIAIEKLPPDEIALLAERAGHDPAAERVIEMFARPALTHGRAMQEALGKDRIAAERRAGGLLERAAQGLDVDERVELVAHLLAAYEYDTAVLQWSYLSSDARAQAQMLPDAVRNALDEQLKSADETVTVAMRLARMLGLQRLHAVDSQYEGVRTLSFPEDALDQVFGPAREAWRASEGHRRFQAARDMARKRDLPAVFRYANSYEGQVYDTAQWAGWLTMGHASGLDRFRFAMCELRNQRMAAYLMDAAVSTKPERVLFIVGFSHKAFVERALEPHLGIRLVQPEAFER